MIQEGLNKSIHLENKKGLHWIIGGNSKGYNLGKFYLNNELIEAPITEGMFMLRNNKTGEIRWTCPKVVKKHKKNEIIFIGEEIINEVKFTYSIDVLLRDRHNGMDMNINWEVDRNLENWEVIVAYQQDFYHNWKCHLYPHEEDSSFVQEKPLTYVGIPSALLYRKNFKTAILFGINPDSDYLNPLSWTGSTGFEFVDQLKVPQYIVSTDFKKGIKYTFPIQLIVSDCGTMVEAVTELVRSWVDINKYNTDKLFVRKPEEGIKLFLEGRRNTSAWIPNKGYRLEFGDPESDFIYIGEQSLSAYFEYLIYEMNGDEFWRQRSFEQMDFILKAQNNDFNSRHYGAIHTAFESGSFNSNDRGNNVGYKPDLNSHIARYMLLTWKHVKDREGINRQDWYDAAVRSINWVLRQQNADGGLPQVVNMETGIKSISVASGRTLPALQDIYLITGDYRYYLFAEELEEFTKSNIEENLCFIGHHPDLPPCELEEASIYGIIEYWLNKYKVTNKKEYLERAVADALISFLWWCPKQLSWVNNPTQCSSAEQEHFLQYSIYNYQNKKNECLYRLYQYTGDYFFKSLYERILQGIFWSQVASGDLKGATHERIADPWLKRGDYDEVPNFNSLGTVYMGEQSLDLMLQLIEMKMINF